MIDRIQSLSFQGAARHGLRLEQTDRAVGEAKRTFQTFSNLIQGEQYSQAWAKKREIEEQLWQHYPLIPQTNPEIRAIWLDRGTLVALRSPQEMAKLFDSLATAGINVVFVETINAGYPIYPSQVAYENNPQTQDWDRLATAIKLGHERQLEIHAWIWTFAIAHQRHNLIIDKPEDYLGPVLSRHPQWA
ncbi:MAG: family 10 glycosylhydrolase [Synechococcaceae cyanobacterium RL_1_2]|nr:family 10 glycosylhydrolase [Synechococcaceae cyanobacterium RL_1_2]